MAATKPTTRLRALELAVASFGEDDCPHKVAFRAQVYFDWLEGKIEFVPTVEEEAPATAAENILPMVKPKGKPTGKLQ